MIREFFRKKKKKPIRVIIESPYAGEKWQKGKNIFYAQQCLRDSLNHGEAPLASHLLYTQDNVLKDEIKEEREIGINAGHTWILIADAIIVYQDLGISEGMRKGINIAMDNNIKVIYRKIL